MKCIIPGPNVKVLGRAIHSLAKLGDELYVESSQADLSFRTVNMSKTAYASFTFSIDFFSFFKDESIADQNAGSLKCQISMKSSLSVFRSPISLDKTVDSLQIKLHPNTDKLMFHIKYKKGIHKTYYVPVIECETLKAFYHKDKSANRLTIQPKIVRDILSNFQSNHDEITWKVTKDSIVIRNYSDTEDVYSGVRTEICVNKDEFDEFKIQTETEITFCLKELRAVLLFSDSVGLPLSANFNVSSKPIVFVIQNEIFEANIVVSTLTGSDYVESQVQSQPRPEEPPVQVSQIRGGDEECHRDRISDINLSQHNRNKLKHVFQKCFQKEVFDVKNMPGYDVILAPDSDPETETESEPG